MTKNLIGIIIAVLFAITAFIINNHVIKIIAATLATIILILVILWIIGFTLDKKEEKKKTNQGEK